MSDQRDRDRLLEGALTRELRATAAPATDACLDAETMAAWTDGGLDSQAIAMAEAHASTCERCQALLATIVRTVPVAAVAEPRTARLWRWWLAPLAASAAAVTLWMVVPQETYVAPPSPAVTAPAAEAAAPGAEAARQEAPPSAPAAPLAAVARVEQSTPGRARANTAPAVAAIDQKAESPKLADRVPASGIAESTVVEGRAAEGRLGAAAPAAALRKQDASEEQQFTAQASPAANVIWRVGRAGLVQLATDGRRFTRLVFPETVDLTAVTATDGSHATVTTADGRVFQTADGGRTWRLRP